MSCCQLCTSKFANRRWCKIGQDDAKRWKQAEFCSWIAEPSSQLLPMSIELALDVEWMNSVYRVGWCVVGNISSE